MAQIIEHPVVTVNKLWDRVVWLREIYETERRRDDYERLKEAIREHNIAFLNLSTRRERNAG